MTDYKYKIINTDAGGVDLQEQLNTLSASGWQLEEIMQTDESTSLTLVLKKDKGKLLKEYCKEWELPFLNKQINGGYIYRIIIGAKHLKKNCLFMDDINALNDIVIELNTGNETTWTDGPIRLHDGIIYTKTYELNRLTLDEQTDITNVPAKNYFFVHQDGFIEYKKLVRCTTKGYNPDITEGYVIVPADLLKIKELLKTAYSLLKKIDYQSSIYFKLQYIADKLYLPKGSKELFHPLYYPPLIIEEVFSMEEIKTNVQECIQKIVDRVWYAYGLDGSSLFK